MASEIDRPRVYGNFRPDKFSAMATAQAWRKKRKLARPGVAPEHLALLRQLPCMVCSARPPNHAHHLRSEILATRAAGMKAADRWAVPLCWQCHDAVHRVGSRHEKAWFIAQNGIDAYLLAQAFWATSGDTTRMNRVMEAHRRAAMPTTRRR